MQLFKPTTLLKDNSTVINDVYPTVAEESRFLVVQENIKLKCRKNFYTPKSQSKNGAKKNSTFSDKVEEHVLVGADLKMRG